jgi:nucleotidyltransferase substrate binding protein (TIGR01987 family)
MERLNQRKLNATKALETLDEILNHEGKSTILRDAAIQRFEYTFEAVWKAAKHFLFVNEGIDIGSPKGVIRSLREVGILEDDETQRALQMVDDRNKTSHTYNQDIAEKISKRLPDYYQLLKKITDAL